MRSFSKFLLASLLIAGALGAAYWAFHPEQPEAPKPRVEPSPSPRPAAAPAIRFPVPPEPPEVAAASGVVPPVDQSDPTLADALSALFGKARVEAIFHIKDIVRRIVVTVENGTGHIQPAEEFWPVKPPAPRFKGERSGEDWVIGAENFRRYEPFVQLARDVDPIKLVALYRHFYPIFQSAYRDLGSPGYFNDHLVDAIDVLLSAPEYPEPIRLTSPNQHKRYKFADARLEALPASQKILIRMGSANAEVIKKKLIQIREQLVQLGQRAG